MKIALVSTAAILTMTTCVSTGHATTWTRGNLLISSNEVLYEVSLDGVVQQSFSIPGTSESARDIVMDTRGRVHVYNGTFIPQLSTFDPASMTWKHQTVPGWSTVNDVSFGGIGSVGDYVFLTDMRTGADTDKDQGLIRYDLSNSTYVRFAEDIEPIDLTIGFNGMLYALYPGGSPGARFVDVYDPSSLAFIETISLASIFGHTGHRSIAVDVDGNMFIADWDGELQKIDADGNVLDTIHLKENLYDVDLSAHGEIAVGSRFGKVFVTDEFLSAPDDFDRGGNGVFVAFVTVPEPTTCTLALVALVASCFHGRRRR